MVPPVIHPIRTATRTATLAAAARELAAALLGASGDRWRHTVGVAARAADLGAQLSHRFGPEATDRVTDVLVAAAWLHDIGYAKPIAHTGFHPLDGARHLDRTGWPLRIAGLVAHHSGARFIAAARGLDAELAAYPDEDGLLADALTYADQTIGPCGDPVTPTVRYAEMLRRHGPDSDNARVDGERGAYLRALAARVEAAGRAPQHP